MEQYIPKSAVVAKIDDWRDKIEKGILTTPLNGRQRSDAAFEYEILGIVRDFLDTFEVKVVDLESEWVKYFENRGDMATVNIKHLAKHFFELGMAASNKVQKGK